MVKYPISIVEYTYLVIATGIAIASPIILNKDIKLIKTIFLFFLQYPKTIVMIKLIYRYNGGLIVYLPFSPV